MKVAIKSRDPLRAKVAQLSTSNGNYYQHKSDVLGAIDGVLFDQGLTTGEVIDMYGDDGRKVIPILDMLTGNEVASILLMWHRMEVSGRYEMTLYIT